MNETILLTPRQKAIVNLVALDTGASRGYIASNLPSAFSASKATLARDLATLAKAKLILALGNGPSTIYKPVQSHQLLAYMDLEQYFALEPDERKQAKTQFNPTLFDKVPGVISELERRELQTVFRSFSGVTQRLDHTILERELERYLVELSWKSSKIEGNTYTLLETENLIKQGEEARGRAKQEAQMILNHKDAFGTILNHRVDFRKLSTTNILELHNTLTKGLSIVSGIRKQAVGITGTTYRPPENEWQVRDAFERMIKVINTVAYPLEKAILTLALLAYIQPFADGNKRTARMLSNALLLAHDYFPLSYRSIDENEYKGALILFFETNNLYHVKRLFLEQYRFALNTYFVSEAKIVGY